jgi:hypothetical protein
VAPVCSAKVSTAWACWAASEVFRTDAGTPRPHGAYFALEILWRGAGYGMVDTLLLTAFHCVVAYSIARHVRRCVAQGTKHATQRRLTGAAS